MCESANGAPFLHRVPKSQYPTLLAVLTIVFVCTSRENFKLARVAPPNSYICRCCASTPAAALPAELACLSLIFQRREIKENENYLLYVRWWCYRVPPSPRLLSACCISFFFVVFLIASTNSTLLSSWPLLQFLLWTMLVLFLLASQLAWLLIKLVLVYN